MIPNVKEAGDWQPFGALPTIIPVEFLAGGVATASIRSSLFSTYYGTSVADIRCSGADYLPSL